MWWGRGEGAALVRALAVAAYHIIFIIRLLPATACRQVPACREATACYCLQASACLS